MHESLCYNYYIHRYNHYTLLYTALSCVRVVGDTESFVKSLNASSIFGVCNCPMPITGVLKISLAGANNLVPTTSLTP